MQSGLEAYYLSTFGLKETQEFMENWRRGQNRGNHSEACVGAFSGRIGLPPAVMGWAASCDDGP